MVFRKKRRMLDIREMQKKGMIRMPSSNPSSVQTNSEGFVDFSSENLETTQETTSQLTPPSSPNLFGFMETPTPTTPTTSNNEDLRKISAQLSELDNKLYKLEQRIEVLERKTNTGY